MKPKSATRVPPVIVPGRLTLGQRSDEVKDLQILLRDADLYDHAVDGYYDNNTRQGVAILQERIGVPMNGHWGDETVSAVKNLLAQGGVLV